MTLLFMTCTCEISPIGHEQLLYNFTDLLQYQHIFQYDWILIIVSMVIGCEFYIYEHIFFKLVFYLDNVIQIKETNFYMYAIFYSPTCTAALIEVSYKKNIMLSILTQTANGKYV